MNNSVKSKAEALLKSENSISEIDLINNEIDLDQLDSATIEKLFLKINKKEIAKASKSSKKEFASIYKEQNEYMEANKLRSLKGSEKETFFKKKRQKIRNKMFSFISIESPNVETKKEFLKFLSENFTKADLKDTSTFSGGSLSKIKGLMLKRFVNKLLSLSETKAKAKAKK